MMAELLPEAMGNVVMDSGVEMSAHLSTATTNEMAEHLGINSSGGLDKCTIGEIRPKECDKGANNKMKNARDQFQIDISEIKYKSRKRIAIEFLKKIKQHE